MSVPAPRRFALVLGALPLLLACSADEGKTTPASAPTTPAAPAEPEPGPGPAKEPEPAPTTAVRPPVPDDDPGAWGQQSMPPDLGAHVDPPPEPPPDPGIGRLTPTKYGGPPRPAKKYGAPPRPDPSDDPLGGL